MTTGTQTRSGADAPARPQGCTNLKLRQLGRRVTSLYDAELAKAGLKVTQYSLLSHVVKLGPVRPVDLAAAMRMSASTLSRNLQPLVAQGLLAVLPGEDARSRLVVTTEAGQLRRAEAQRRWRTAQEQLNQILGVERVLALHSLVDEALELLTPHELGEDDA
jgi:DNA-binding MarR family transcriptional regulator